MKKISLTIVFVVILSVSTVCAGLLDEVFKGSDKTAVKQPKESTAIAGLKEALEIGTERAVKDISRPDGYFANPKIRIPMPEKIQKVSDVLEKVGYKKEVDAFVLSMNRAAEKAAPQAAPLFVEAIKKMSVQDAQKILGGGDTAATKFFQEKTHGKLFGAFKPVVSRHMDEVGVARNYKDMIGKYESVPFVDKQSLDLDDYVTNKALDGLFYSVGQEEKKIRRDPAARVTDLLRTVFGK